MADALPRLIDTFSAAQAEQHHAGRTRCRNGSLVRSPETVDITPDLYAAQDFIIAPDFLTHAACDLLLSCFAPLLTNRAGFDLGRDYWQGRMIHAHEVGAHNAEAGAEMKRFQREATMRLQQFYALDAPIYADTVQLNWWPSGLYMPPHADNANPDGSPHGMPWRSCASVVYLNDDYDGGELYFTALDRLIKPKKGMLVAFTGGFHHEHAVLRISGGDRFTMPAFYTPDRTRADRYVYPELFAASVFRPPVLGHK